MCLTELTDACLNELKLAGAQAAQVSVARHEKKEVNLENGEFSLLRTTYNLEVALTALLGGRKGSVVINQSDEQSVRKAAADAVELARASQDDEANQIADLEDGQDSFSDGPQEPDLPKMYERLNELLAETRRRCPKVTLLEGFVAHDAGESLLRNTNGVSLESREGRYTVNVSFLAKDGERASSISGTGAVTRDLDTPLWELAGIGMLIEQNEKELEARSISEKFEGDVVLSPTALTEFLMMYCGCYLTDRPLIAGSSVLKDKLGQRVASECISLVSDPQDKTLVSSPVTSEGYRAKPMTIFENGVLKSFILSQYGANKTGRARSGNFGDNACVRPGGQTLDELVGGVKRGVLVGRFSGGMPGDNGDFSGVAKNSFFIEDGKVTVPVTETMISGNLRALFDSVAGISRETISTGDMRQPWVWCKGIVISGA